MRALLLVLVLTACTADPSEEVAASAIQYACSAVDGEYATDFLTATPLTEPFLTVAGDSATHEPYVYSPRDGQLGYRNQRPGTLIAANTVTSCEIVDDAYRAREAATRQRMDALFEKAAQGQRQTVELIKTDTEIWRAACSTMTSAQKDAYDCDELPPE